MWMSTCPQEGSGKTIGEFLPYGETEYDIANPKPVNRFTFRVGLLEPYKLKHINNMIFKLDIS